MSAAWMVQALLVSGLLAAAALVAERAASSWRRPGRFLWATAIGGGALLPVLSLARPELWPSAGPAAEAARTLVLAPLRANATASGTLLTETPGFDAVLLALWLIASLAIGARLLGGAIHVRRRRSDWEPARVDGTDLLVSRNAGPAVTGVLRPRIVVPRWVLELEPPRRALVLLHEREHVRAHDHRLWIAAVAIATAMPWNLPLWWLLHRMRLSIERDCDRRVLEGGADLGVYGRLLVEVGRRGTAVRTLAPALAEPTSFLERRIRAMIEQNGRRSRAVGLVAGAAGAILLLVACDAAAPPEVDRAPSEQIPTPGPVAARDAEVKDGSADPIAAAHPVPPKLLNASDVSRTLEREFPEDLRDRGIEGSVGLWLHVDEYGEVDGASVKESSGYAEFDAAALRVAESMQFEPAHDDDGTARAVWILQPILFKSTS